MDYKTKQPQLPKLIEPTLQNTHQPIDNIFADAWRSLRIGACATSTKLTKRKRLRRTGRDLHAAALALA